MSTNVFNVKMDRASRTRCTNKATIKVDETKPKRRVADYCPSCYLLQVARQIALHTALVISHKGELGQCMGEKQS